MVDNMINNSVADIQQLLSRAAGLQSQGLLGNVMVETIGMSMHNAVNAQHNAQIVNSATTTSTCAKILSVSPPKAKKPASPPPSPPWYSPPSSPPSPPWHSPPSSPPSPSPPGNK
ncbi:MAG: RebB family R body protein [Bacteroidetes bacterium]|nr:RebB family R body protein [Bacteroidota bacterium]